MLMGYQRGTFSVQYSTTSVQSLSSARLGSTRTFAATSRQKVSFWKVPISVLQLAPCLRASEKYIEGIGGWAMTSEVETCPSGMSAKRRSMYSSEEQGTPWRPTSPCESGWSELSPWMVGMS